MNLVNKNISYQVGDDQLIGYMAYDDDIESVQPGVIVIHEWWGINDYIRRRTNMLAELGYCVLAIDVYGNGKTAGSAAEANELMTQVLENMDAGTRRLKAGLDTLLAEDRVDNNRTAAIGYCFGGAAALHMARIGLPLNAVVSFHGALGSFHQPKPGEVDASILVCYGEADAMVPVEDLSAFKQEMDNARADYRVLSLAGAQHGFTSPEADDNARKYGIPVGYNPEADKVSWQAMQDFFREKL